jgi:hypothetical protein
MFAFISPSIISLPNTSLKHLYIIEILADHVQLNKPSYNTIDTHNYSLVNKSIYYIRFYLIMLCMLLFLFHYTEI